MDLALYEPALGYYVNGATVFGAGGDFVTAPELSRLFGACIAHQCIEVLADTGGSIFEFGGGTGRLAASLLAELDQHNSLPDRYYILELSPELRKRQQEYLRSTIPAVLERVTWLSGPPRSPISGVIIANEILDAIPVKVFRLDGESTYERRVNWQDNTLAWRDVPADPSLETIIDRVIERSRIDHEVGYISEINMRLSPWIAELANMLGRGVALLVDYGYPGHEYYHPDRTEGTMLCHYRHRVHGDPFLYPGLQDMTAAVNFTAVAEAADQAGLEVVGFANQAAFLLSCGLPEILERGGHGGDEAQIRLAQEVKVLTLPTEMGERCKVMALGKGYAGPMRGFSLRDERHRLTGMAGL